MSMIGLEEKSNTIMKRLVTRSYFDGLVCAMILKELNLIDEIKFVHPENIPLILLISVALKLDKPNNFIFLHSLNI